MRGVDAVTLAGLGRSAQDGAVQGVGVLSPLAAPSSRAASVRVRGVSAAAGPGRPLRVGGRWSGRWGQLGPRQGGGGS